MRYMPLRALAGPLSPISLPVSDKYEGTAEDMHPMANPVSSLPTIICATLYDEAWMTEPRMATAFPRIMVPRRPSLNEKGAMAMAVIHAARSYDATIYEIYI